VARLPNSNVVDFKSELRSLRLSRNYSGQELCYQLRVYGVNIYPNAVSAWENGRIIPSPSQMDALEKVFGKFTFRQSEVRYRGRKKTRGTIVKSVNLKLNQKEWETVQRLGVEAGINLNKYGGVAELYRKIVNLLDEEMNRR